MAATTRLGEPEREVVVLRLLLGHSLDHTAHLSGYSRRAAMELQLVACLAIHELTGGPTGVPGDVAPAPAPPAEEFERRLGRWEVDLTAGDPALADALAAAGSLRRAIPGYVVAPSAELVQRLRADLVAGRDPQGPGARCGAPGPGGCGQPRAVSAPVPYLPPPGASAAGGRGSGRPGLGTRVGVGQGPGPAGSRAGGAAGRSWGDGVAGEAAVGGDRGGHGRDRGGAGVPGVRGAGGAAGV